MEKNRQIKGSELEFLSVKEMFDLCLSKWKWFVASLAFFIFVAVSYIFLMPPTYVRSVSFLLKSSHPQQQAVSSPYGITLAELNTTRDDEIITIQSPLLMERVVKTLELGVDYSTKSLLRKRVLYGKNAPYKVCFLDTIPAENLLVTIRRQGKDEVLLTDFYKDDEKLETPQPIKTALSVSASTPLGRILVLPNPDYTKSTSNIPVIAHQRSLRAATGYFLRHLSVEDSKSGLLKLYFRDESAKRAADVLTNLLTFYDESYIKGQADRVVNTVAFINKRLSIVEQELGEVENNISSYKSANLITESAAGSGAFVQQSQEISTRMQSLKTEQSILKYVKYCLTSEMTKYKLLPVTGLSNGAIEGRVASYNELIAQRDKFISNGNQHPQIAEIEQTLASLRTVILESIDNLDATISVELADLNKNLGSVTRQIASTPEQAKHLLSIERQQKVKESIYLFLLQKLEETELNGMDVATNIKMISPVSGGSTPVSPQSRKILLLAFVIGLFLPMVIIFAIEIADTKINNRKDLESCSLPFLGEIPLVKDNAGLFKRKKKHFDVVVEENSSNVINEAFRILRTNLGFIWRQDKSKVIMLTSFMSGSGKTFTSINLGVSLAIQGKKVLILDLDLRKAAASKYVKSHHVGVSGVLNGSIDSAEGIIVRGELHPNLDLIPVGVIPPNPTELLANDRLDSLLNSLRPNYDYIIVDCPPLDVVADAKIINKHVDMTLFVIRSGVMDKSMLPALEDFYEDHDRTSVCVLLNGVDLDKVSNYNYYGYGYGKYSYHN